jgi:hypothetical protein
MRPKKQSQPAGSRPAGFPCAQREQPGQAADPRSDALVRLRMRATTSVLGIRAGPHFWTSAWTDSSIHPETTHRLGRH